jgi:hypothetical protein
MGSRALGVRLAGLVAFFGLFGLFGAATAAVAAGTLDVTTTTTSSMRGHATATIDAQCAGDTIFGHLVTDAPAGTSYTLALFQKQVRRGLWLSTGQTVAIVTRRGQQSYPFSFDVSSYGAFAYAITGASKDEIVRGASCAPGHQVPEAPNTLLLAAAVAGVFGLSLARRRRRRCIR